MRTLTAARRTIIAASFLLGVASGVSRVTLSPTTLLLPGTQRSVSVTVTNAGDTPLDFQVTALQWTQDGNDILTPTDQVLAAPAQFTLAPGAQQVIRVARLTPAPTTQRAFRLQILQAPGAGGGLQMGVRHLLPLFDGPAGTAALTGTAQSGVLTLRNAGNAAVRLANLEVQVGAAWLPIGLHYVLPGSRIQLPLPGAASPSQLRYLDLSGQTVTVPLNLP